MEGEGRGGGGGGGRKGEWMGWGRVEPHAVLSLVSLPPPFILVQLLSVARSCLKQCRQVGIDRWVGARGGVTRMEG